MTQADLGLTAVQHRSYSQIRQLRTCGEQFRLERIERVPSRPNCAAVAGVVIHTATETIDQQIHDGNGEAVGLTTAAMISAMDAFDEQVAKRTEHYPLEQWKRYGRRTTEKPNGEDMAWFKQVGIPNAVAAYVDWRLGNDDFTLVEIPNFGPAIEVPFLHYVEGTLVHGFIDRIFTSKRQGGYYPFDLKSGQKPETDEQLGLYAMAIRKALGWEPRWGYYIYAMKTGTAKLTKPIDLSHWDDAKLSQIYGPATLAIDQGIFIPHPGEACFHCGVSEHCEFAQAAI